jgi:diguanylate cyclase (GGDEF)-like protein
MDASKNASDREFGNAERDVVALGIAAAAILMFVGTGGSVLPQIARAWMGIGSGPDRMLVNALLLNIALIIFGWRRYSELVREIAERRRAEELARRLAETDPLTGCLNRRSVTGATDELIATAHESGRALAFVMVDLDNFKMVNDINGHRAGDTVLLATAERIASMLPVDGLVARLGGDEFACSVAYDEGSPDRIDQLVTRLIDLVSRPVDCDGMSLDVTVSVGIATTAANGKAPRPDADTLMHRADIAMYHAKKMGKNRYFWFEAPMESQLRIRSELEAGIRRGVRDGEFVPFYEQQIDLESGELTGFEMLARWQSPQLGLVSPEVFVPVAEEMGLIGELSEGLIAQALEFAKEWAPHLSLSVNISPVQMRDPWFSQKLVKLLVAHNFPPKRLDIEITESCLHENLGVVRSMITSLRNQGVTISLDDFGTGYSSLAQLRSLPFDRLKIDRSFVTELKDADASSKIVRAIISLGDGLDLPITAEGIEDGQILDTLKSMGRLKGQGYHYGKPEPAAAVRKRLAEAGLLLAGAPAHEDAPADNEQSRREAAG